MIYDHIWRKYQARELLRKNWPTSIFSLFDLCNIARHLSNSLALVLHVLCQLRVGNTLMVMMMMMMMMIIIIIINVFLNKSWYTIQTSPTDRLDDSWRDNFFGKHEHGALQLGGLGESCRPQPTNDLMHFSYNNLTSGGNNFNYFFYCKTFIMTGQPSRAGADFI